MERLLCFEQRRLLAARQVRLAMVTNTLSVLENVIRSLPDGAAVGSGVDVSLVPLFFTAYVSLKKYGFEHHVNFTVACAPVSWG